MVDVLVLVIYVAFFPCVVRSCGLYFVISAFVFVLCCVLNGWCLWGISTLVVVCFPYVALWVIFLSFDVDMG